MVRAFAPRVHPYSLICVGVSHITKTDTVCTVCFHGNHCGYAWSPATSALVSGTYLLKNRNTIQHKSTKSTNPDTTLTIVVRSVLSSNPIAGPAKDWNSSAKLAKNRGKNRGMRAGKWGEAMRSKATIGALTVSLPAAHMVPFESSFLRKYPKQKRSEDKRGTSWRCAINSYVGLACLA